MKKIFIRLILPIVILLLIFIEFISPYTIIRPFRKTPSEYPKDYELAYEDIDIKTMDELTLKGYWVKPKNQASKGVIILLHGISGYKEKLLDKARFLADLGYESILYDSRGHGKSEGKFCTFGVIEKLDVTQVVNLIRAENDTIPIGIWGLSMGGSVTIQSLATEPRLSFGIVESTFRNFKEIAGDYQQDYFPIRLEWLVNYAIKKAERLAKFKAHDIQPIESARKITQPILMSHGTKDTKIKMEYGLTLFEELGTKDKDFYKVVGATHYDVWEKGGEAYEARVKQFLERL